MALVDSYDSIIFDYGGVLVRHQSESDQAQLAAILDLPREQFTELYWSDRAEYDRDALSAAEYWNDIARRGGTTASQQAITKLTELDSKTWMQFDDVMWDWISQLRKSGKQVAILSNMPRDLGEALKRETNRLSEFDQVTLSYETKSAKPDAAIYEHCLEGLDSSPERTLFLDDRIENIQGAEMLGIRAVQFLDRDAVLLQLR